MERYLICGWAINDANFIVPVVGQVSNQPNVEVSDLFYDNAPNDPMVVYGIGVRVKSLADDEEKLMELQNTLLNQARGQAVAIVATENGVTLIKSWEPFVIQNQPLTSWTGDEPCVEDNVDYVILDEDSEEYEGVIELLA